MLDRIFDLAKINKTIAHLSKKMRDIYYNYLINEFGVSFTYHSNRIEGVNTTLTLNDTKKILNNTYDFKGVVDKEKQREINETINHQEAFKYIFEIIKQDIDILDVITTIHKIVGNNIIIGAGSYKRNENYMLLSDGREIDFTKPEKVSQEMLKMRDFYMGDWQKLTVYDRAVNLHMAIVNIHPFSDGNGRVARLVMNYELIKNNYPPVNIAESQKLSYYALLEEININTDYENEPLNYGNIDLFSETIQQLSIVTFKNMQQFLHNKFEI